MWLRKTNMLIIWGDKVAAWCMLSDVIYKYLLDWAPPNSSLFRVNESAFEEDPSCNTGVQRLWKSAAHCPLADDDRFYL